MEMMDGPGSLTSTAAAGLREPRPEWDGPFPKWRTSNIRGPGFPSSRVAVFSPNLRAWARSQRFMTTRALVNKTSVHAMLAFVHRPIPSATRDLDFLIRKKFISR
jgi:hypothetical protein